MNELNPLLSAALKARRSGVSTVPVELPAKTPPYGFLWKDRETKLPNERTIRQDLANGNGNTGFAIIGGAVSGNLEIFDFDLAGAAYPEWVSLVEAEAPGLINRLSIQQTMSGGYHAIARCAETKIPGSQKLARKRVEVRGPGKHEYQGKKYTAKQHGGQWFLYPTLIETKGEGGYAVAAPSPGYAAIQTPQSGEFFDFPEITAAEREILHRCAKALDEKWPETIIDGPKQKTANANDLRPGDDFNRRGNVLETLLRDGWKPAGGNAERHQLTRPGKDKGISATLYDGRVLHVFSSNADPFEMDKSYSAFAVYSLLELGGDYSKAAGELARQGYGEQKKDTPKGGGELNTEQIPADPHALFQFVHNADILADLKPIEWRIGDILTEHALYYNFGDPGHFKTFIELDRLLCIASGIDYHGHKVKQGTVFYICGEGWQGIGRRIAAWHNAHRTKAADVPFFVSRTPTQLMDIEAIQDVSRAVDAMAKHYGPPAVVHIDTLARNFGEGDENATKDMNKAISNLDKAFLNDLCRGLTHHTGHANKERARGAMALHGAADGAFRISLTASGQIVVECKKLKDAPTAPMMIFSRREVLLQIGDTEDKSYVLELAAEGIDAEAIAKPRKVAELKGGLKKALDILRRLHKRYAKNLGKIGRPAAGSLVSYVDWRTACMDAKLYSRTDTFGNAAEKMHLENYIKYDETKTFVYPVEIINDAND